MTTLYDFTVKDINNKEWDLSELKGKVVLFVNVASKCGFTKQYGGLEELYKKYLDKGLVIVGAPCNQFGSQGKIIYSPFLPSQTDIFFFFKKKNLEMKKKFKTFVL